MSVQLKPAVVLAGHTMGLGVIRSLGMKGVPVTSVYYDDRDVAFASRYVGRVVRAPHPERAEGQFVNLLMDIGPSLDGGFLVPTSDATVSTLSRHKTLLERHYVVACTDWDTTEKFLDKRITSSIAESAGVPAPRTIVPRSEEDVVHYSEGVQFPCLVKPSHSHRYYAVFHHKMVMARNLDEMMDAYRQASSAGFEVMLQEYIPGEDSNGANYNAYFWDGEPLLEFTAQKLRNAPSGLGSPRVAVSRHIPEIIEPGRRILRAMGFYGYACTEFKRDPRDGVYKLMEVNGRHNLSTLLAVSSGINFPWLHYKHLVLGDKPGPRDFQDGIYWIDLLRDIAYSFKARGQERYDLFSYIRPYLGPRVFAILDANDPGPFLRKFTGIGSIFRPMIQEWGSEKSSRLRRI